MNHLKDHPLTLSLLAMARHKTEAALAAGDAGVIRDYHTEVMGAYELWGIALFAELEPLSRDDFFMITETVLASFRPLDEAAARLQKGAQ